MEKENLNIEPQLHSIEDLEIFESGNWRGDVYTEQDLDEIVEAFSHTREALKPHLKLGHSDKQTLLQKDGYPAAGWITGLKRSGKKLLATVENIPDKIYDLIQKKAYGRISSEIYWNLKLNDKKHRRALRAVALLGGDTPEVHSLNDFINLYTENFDAELKIYDTKETDMSEDKKLHELETEIKEFNKKLSEFENENRILSQENSKLKEDFKTMEYNKKVSEVENYLEGQVSEGRITPAQVKFYRALLIDDGEEVKTYTDDNNHKVECTSFDLVKAIVENSKQVDFAESSQHKEVERESELTEDEKLHDKVAAYAKEHNVSYNEAFDVIAMEVK